MSHGKKAYIIGRTKAMITMPNGRKFDFKAEEEVGLVLTHGKITGDASSAEAAVVSEINSAIAKKWKDNGGTGTMGATFKVGKDDLNWDMRTAK